MTEFEFDASLQSFAQQKGISIEQLKAATMIKLMVDWYRFVALDTLGGSPLGDTLVYRYGSWSDGCVTGFKYSLLRRANLLNNPQDASAGEVVAGITMLFEPSRYSDVTPAETVLTNQNELSGFVAMIEGSPGFQLSADRVPMAVSIESRWISQ